MNVSWYETHFFALLLSIIFIAIIFLLIKDKLTVKLPLIIKTKLKKMLKLYKSSYQLVGSNKILLYSTIGTALVTDFFQNLMIYLVSLPPKSAYSFNTFHYFYFKPDLFLLYFKQNTTFLAIQLGSLFYFFYLNIIFYFAIIIALIFKKLFLNFLRKNSSNKNIALLKNHLDISFIIALFSFILSIIFFLILSANKIESPYFYPLVIFSLIIIFFIGIYFLTFIQGTIIFMIKNIILKRKINLKILIDNSLKIYPELLKVNIFVYAIIFLFEILKAGSLLIHNHSLQRLLYISNKVLYILSAILIILFFAMPFFLTFKNISFKKALKRNIAFIKKNYIYYFGIIILGFLFCLIPTLIDSIKIVFISRINILNLIYYPLLFGLDIFISLLINVAMFKFILSKH